MPNFRTATVAEVTAERRGLQKIRVKSPSSDPSSNGEAASERAYVLTEMIGRVQVGDEVVINTTAIDLALGTGGWHFVHWNLSRRELKIEGGGHIMKMRYTSAQIDSGSADEDGMEFPPVLAGLPVVTCGLHSQVAVIAAVLGHLQPGIRVAYVMTDGASLPIAMSDLVESLLARELLVGTVTSGHAFGGDHEAIGIPSALTTALGSFAPDVVLVAMGPGVVGTASTLGFSALEQAPILDSTAWLGGVPILCARASSGDKRPRHQGLSHHSVTVLNAVRSSVTVPLPREIETEAIPARHHIVRMTAPAVAEALEAADLGVTTMNRGLTEDRLFFDTAACAAGHVLSLLSP